LGTSTFFADTSTCDEHGRSRWHAHLDERAEALTTLARKAGVVGASFLKDAPRNGFGAASGIYIAPPAIRGCRTFKFATGIDGKLEPDRRTNRGLIWAIRIAILPF
jgi:hypothetical protein